MRLQKSDVITVANSLNVNITDKQIQKILNEFDAYCQQYTEETWQTIIEIQIDEVVK